jgi:hypothetical protein
MAKQSPRVLQDHLGRDLKINDPIAFFHRKWKTMRTGRIVKISKVNVTVAWTMLSQDDYRSVKASEVILLDEAAYVFHCMRKDCN